MPHPVDLGGEKFPLRDTELADSDWGVSGHLQERAQRSTIAVKRHPVCGVHALDFAIHTSLVLGPVRRHPVCLRVCQGPWRKCNILPLGGGGLGRWGEGGATVGVTCVCRRKAERRGRFAWHALQLVVWSPLRD